MANDGASQFIAEAFPLDARTGRRPVSTASTLVRLPVAGTPAPGPTAGLRPV